MRAVLISKGGFKKEVVVPNPPPSTWYMAETDDNHNLYHPGDGIEALADIVIRQRLFRLRRVSDPENYVPPYQHNAGSIEMGWLREKVFKEHMEEFGDYEARAIYEEERMFSKEEIQEQARQIALKKGWISDIPVEADNKRFIELDNEFQDP